jgi:hypothetical protein
LAGKIPAMARWLRERNRAKTQYGNKKSVYQFFRPFIIDSPRAATKFQKETTETAPRAAASLHPSLRGQSLLGTEA